MPARQDHNVMRSGLKCGVCKRFVEDKETITTPEETLVHRHCGAVLTEAKMRDNGLSNCADRGNVVGQEESLEDWFRGQQDLLSQLRKCSQAGMGVQPSVASGKRSKKQTAVSAEQRLIMKTNKKMGLFPNTLNAHGGEEGDDIGTKVQKFAEVTEDLDMADENMMGAREVVLSCWKDIPHWTS
jgi:hypothetical protein